MREEQRQGGNGHETPRIDSVKALVSQEFWDERHRRIRLKHISPQPQKYYLDYELDRVFRRWLGPRSGQRLLEVGCGSSLWLPYFSRQFGMQVAGIDYSDVGLAMSEKILRLNAVHGSLRKVDFRDGPGPDRESFDIVFSLGLVEHFEDPRRVLAILKDFVRTGGLLLTWLPNTAGFIPRMNPHLNRVSRRFYTPLDLTAIRAYHRSLGFHILQSSYLQFLDFSFLTLDVLPGRLQKWMALTFRAFGLFLMALEKAVSGPIQSPLLCAGMIVVALRRD
jgi:SAM-dependent methyltransferase